MALIFLLFEIVIFYTAQFCPLKYKPFDEHAACAKPSTYLVAGGRLSTQDIM